MNQGSPERLESEELLVFLKAPLNVHFLSSQNTGLLQTMVKDLPPGTWRASNPIASKIPRERPIHSSQVVDRHGKPSASYFFM